MCKRRYHLLRLFFFFQAEDGIRDLVRSRGLGDVYKRQADNDKAWRETVDKLLAEHAERIESQIKQLNQVMSVSYTHLTLPTSDLV